MRSLISGLPVLLLSVALAPAAEPEAKFTLRGHQTAIAAVAVGGPVVASAEEHRGGDIIKLWDATTGRELRTIEPRFGIRLAALAVSPDGKTVVAADYCGKTNIWNAATGEERKTTFGFGSALAPLHFTPDGKRLFATSEACRVRSWDVEKWEVETTSDVIARPRCSAAAFTPDGKTVAFAGRDQIIRLVDVETHKETATLHGSPEIRCLDFSPDGRTLAASGHQMLTLWDVAEQKARHNIAAHEMATIHAVAFSPDGRTVATASREATVKLWNAATGQLRATLSGHGKDVTAIVFTPDGKSLISGSMDTTLKVWDLSFLRRSS
jgi:WD40 repeat protein